MVQKSCTQQKCGMLFHKEPVKIHGNKSTTKLPQPGSRFQGCDLNSPSSGPDMTGPRLLDERECIKIVDFGLSNTFQDGSDFTLRDQLT